MLPSCIKSKNCKPLLVYFFAIEITSLRLASTISFFANLDSFSPFCTLLTNFLKSDMTWHKSTQSFSSSDNFFKVLWNNALREDLSKYKINWQFDPTNKFNHNDVKAFFILGLSIGIKCKNIKEKFKKLVKKYHPDMNAGNKKYEDKLKVITLAYTQLKNTYREKN